MVRYFLATLFTRGIRGGWVSSEATSLYSGALFNDGKMRDVNGAEDLLSVGVFFIDDLAEEQYKKPVDVEVDMGVAKEYKARTTMLESPRATIA